MKTLRPVSLFAFFVVFTSGCAATYTSIRKQDDGTYSVTRTKSGFMGITSGKLFQCAPAANGLAMRCNEVSTP